MKYLIMSTLAVFAVALVCTGCKPGSEITKETDPKTLNVQADVAPTGIKLWDDDPVGNRIADLSAVLEMRKKVAKTKMETGKDISFSADRKAEGQPYMGQGCWALTMWPEDASDYRIYRYSVDTPKRSFPWQVFAVDPISKEIKVIESRKTGKLISLEDWLKKGTCLYTIEEALSDNYENYQEILSERDRRLREQNSPAGAGQ